MHEIPGQAVDNVPLLRTKLFVPRTRAAVVRRTRLIDRLAAGRRRTLTLVVAPAGFGKTTILTDWLSAIEASELDAPGGETESFAWVSLDAEDSDPVRFWTYVIAAIRKVAPDLGLAAFEMLHASEPLPFRTVLTTLINDIADQDQIIHVVLDDLHLVDNDEVFEGIRFLLDNHPPNLHVVVASRSEPPLPLATYRARGELNELRSDDLRFTEEEASEFLSDLLPVELSPGAVRRLEERTEGWIAGLQLAALSMKGRDDVDGFIASFSGDTRYVADFLVHEILEHQPVDVRRFLLQTSILDRMCGSLCNAVTDGKGGGKVLRELERSNLFVVPLDDTGRWYRYHHLFADVLRAHLEDEQPVLVPALHRRASVWFEEHGSPTEAIRHAFEAGDTARSADLVERAWREMDRSFRSAEWLRLAERIPTGLVDRRPVLSMEIGWAHLDVGRIDEAVEYLEIARGWLDAEAGEGADKMVVADETEYAALPATLAAAEAYLAQARGHVDEAVALAGEALELLPPDDVFYRGILSVIVGMARWTEGALEQSFSAFGDGTNSFRDAGRPVVELAGLWVQAEIRRAQGRLREAEAMYRRASEAMESRLGYVPPTAVNCRVGLADVACKRRDIEAARAYLEEAEGLAERSGSDDADWRILTSRADLAVIDGDLEAAFRLLEEAEHVATRERLPDWRPILARIARVHILQGRFEQAEAWVRSSGVSIHDEPTFLREFELLTLARLDLARGLGIRSGDEAKLAEFLDRLLEAAEAGGRVGSRIEILILQALAFHQDGDTDGALERLENALALAEPEGYEDLFVREGEPIRDLLARAAAAGIGGAYTRRLLGQAVGANGGGQDPAASSGLIDPLTPRETEILRLVASGLRNRDIAEQLFISLATVKRHIANVYGKLEAGNRTEAVAIANRLGLL